MQLCWALFGHWPPCLRDKRRHDSHCYVSSVTMQVVPLPDTETGDQSRAPSFFLDQLLSHSPFGSVLILFMERHALPPRPMHKGRDGGPERWAGCPALQAMPRAGGGLLALVQSPEAGRGPTILRPKHTLELHTHAEIHVHRLSHMPSDVFHSTPFI